MDQVFQLQQQIQRLQQEVNGISQVCNQLQQSEQANALQLQQMSQKEMLASQGLRRIQQAAGQLSQEINLISGMAQQMTSQVSPMQRNLQSTGITGQTNAFLPQIGVGSYYSQPGTSVYGGQIGTFGQVSSPQYGLAPMQNQSFNNPNLLGNQSGIQHQGSQGYIGNQFNTGGQTGQSTQSFSSPGLLQGTGQNLSGLSSNLGQSTFNNAMNQMGMGNLMGQQSQLSNLQPSINSQGMTGFSNRENLSNQQISALNATSGNNHFGFR